MLSPKQKGRKADEQQKTVSPGYPFNSSCGNPGIVPTRTWPYRNPATHRFYSAISHLPGLYSNVRF